jgi:hypothetical protein
MTKAIQWLGDNAVDIAALTEHQNFTHKKGVLTVHNKNNTVTINLGEFLIKYPHGNVSKYVNHKDPNNELPEGVRKLAEDIDQTNNLFVLNNEIVR